jgi:hypothetical protein
MHYQQNLFAIDGAYAQDLARIDAAYTSAAQQIRRATRFMVAIVPGSQSTPVRPVSEGAALHALRTQCEEIDGKVKELADAGSDVTSFQPLSKQCGDTYTRLYTQALGTEYWAADAPWIDREIHSSTEALDLESLFVYSHNVRIRAYIHAQLAEAWRLRLEAVRMLDFERSGAVAMAGQVRTREIAHAKREFALAMAAMGEGLTQANRTAAGSSY